MILTRSTLAVATTLALTLTACSKGSEDGNTTAMAPPALPATLPMTTGAATNPALAPAAAALPARRIEAARLANPRDAYAYADQAADYAGALEDAPPDYGFDYDGVEPWAWQDANGYRMFAEPIDDGYRYYYYRPGADTPYFVRDPDYGYGYDGTRLAVIYTVAGALLPYAEWGPRLGYGGAYWGRGRDLYRASLAADRRAVVAATWVARSAAIADSRARWIAARYRQADWRAYHNAQPGGGRAYFAGEAVRRQADAQHFADWRRDDFRGPPPPRAIPAAWRDAGWARNRADYAPVARPEARAGGPHNEPPRQAPRPAGGPAGARHDLTAPEPRRNAPPSSAGPQRQPVAQPARPADRSQPRAEQPAGSPDHADRRPQSTHGPEGPRTAPRAVLQSPADHRGEGSRDMAPHARTPVEARPAATAHAATEPRAAAQPHFAAPPHSAPPRAIAQPQPHIAAAQPQPHMAAPPRAAPQPHAAPAPHPAAAPGGQREHH